MKAKLLFITFLAVMSAIVCRAQLTEPYAIISGDTLTLFYDGNEHLAGKSFTSSYENLSWLQDGIKVVVFDKSIKDYRPVSCKNWFLYCFGLQKIIGLEYLNTEDVVDMSGMFSSCRNLETLDLSSFNTQQVNDMSEMFSDCSNLKSIDLSSFSTEKVNNMSKMFNNCDNLETLDLSSFNTQQVNDMSEMFSDCSNLKSIDLSSFSTEKVNNMSNMFNNCDNIETINLSGFTVDESSCNVETMFANCKNLKTIYANNWNTNTSNPCHMFTDCKQLYGGSGTKYFYTGSQLAHIDDGEKNPGYFTKPGAKPFTPSKLQPYVILKDSVLTFYYGVDKTGNGKPIKYYTKNNSSAVKKAVFDPSFKNCKPEYMEGWSYLFSNYDNLTEIVNMNKYLSTVGVKNFQGMFADCKSIEVLDLSSFDTRSADGKIGYMFSGCSSLKTIFVSYKWHTGFYGCCWYPYHVFDYCPNLIGGQGTRCDGGYHTYDDGCYARIDGGRQYSGFFTLSGHPYNPKEYAAYKDGVLTLYYDKPKPKNAKIYYIGKYDSDADNIKKIVFDRSFRNYAPESCSEWFRDLENLEEIVGMKENLNTKNLKDVSEMFSYCRNLTSVDLSGFTPTNTIDISRIFLGCERLKVIYANENWNPDFVSGEYPFSYCYTLFGGMGTRYEDNADIKYARIDGGEENPGYFTKVGATPYEPKDFAVFKDSTLTFYYSDIKPQNVEIYSISGCQAVRLAVKKIIFDDSFRNYAPKSCAEWFSWMTNLTEIIGMRENLNTENVEDMSEMFNNCSKLETLDLSGFNTAKVNNMQYMFNNCSHLKTIYVSDKWNTSSVKKSEKMFSYYNRLVGGEGTHMPFADLNYAHIDGGKDNPGLFTEFGKPEYDPTKQQSNAEQQKPDIQESDEQQSEPQQITVQTPKDSVKIKENKSTRLGYAVLKDSILTFYSGKKVPNGAFAINNNRQTPPWSNRAQEIKKVVFTKSFAKYRPTSCYEWFSGCIRLIEIIGMREYLNTSAVTDMAAMFMFCCNLKNIDLGGFNTDSVKSMHSMFSGCKSLNSLSLSSFNTANVKNMAFMFESCEKLKNLDLKHFNTEKVQNMGSMFFGCNNIESLDLSNFNTSECQNFTFMFGGCTNLNSVDVSSFYISHYGTAEDFNGMFTGCSSLKNLNLFAFESGEDEWEGLRHYNGDMSRLFYGCKSLEVIDLSGWHIGSPCSMNSTFANCTSLKTIYVSGEWELKYESINYVIGEYESVSYYLEILPSDFYHVFFNCPNLTGGAGTKWNSSDVSNPAYLKIDAESRVETKCDEETDWNKIEYLVPAVPGYFTRKE